MIIGDMNRKIGNDEYGVKNKKHKISLGGHIIRNLIKDELYILVYNLEIVMGGPLTYVDRQDNTRKICWTS